jgi:hypothetical protein
VRVRKVLFVGGELHTQFFDLDIDQPAGDYRIVPFAQYDIDGLPHHAWVALVDGLDEYDDLVNQTLLPIQWWESVRGNEGEA